MERPAASSGFHDSKPHYAILDGLRGVASFVVIWYHVFEGFASSPADQRFNHGYLAVDFFFILSGFVMGYAYDDRWSGMGVKEFFKRRLVRLHPMVLLGAVFGAAAFLVQGSMQWDGTHVALSAVMLAMLMTMFMIPSAPGCISEVRGNGEMFPLNGPEWSLFFEYIGNILYALWIRRLSVRQLAWLTAAAGIGLAVFAIGNFSGYGHLGVGLSLSEWNFPGGLLRLMFSYSAGLLLARVFKPAKIRGAFWKCSAVLVLLLVMPYAGFGGHAWLNGIYDVLCVTAAFPAIVFMAASCSGSGKTESALCKFLGDISYPVYIIHYPFMYLFYSWVWNDGITFRQALPVAAAMFAGFILLAWICLKLYDEPVRRMLGRKFLR